VEIWLCLKALHRNFNKHTDHLEILCDYQFWFGVFEIGLHREPLLQASSQVVMICPTCLARPCKSCWVSSGWGPGLCSCHYLSVEHVGLLLCRPLPLLGSFIFLSGWGDFFIPWDLIFLSLTVVCFLLIYWKQFLKCCSLCPGKQDVMWEEMPLCIHTHPPVLITKYLALARQVFYHLGPTPPPALYIMWVK
jgi:hypothetical protein